MTDLKTVMQNDETYYMNTFGKRCPVCFTHGRGIKLFATDGRAYYDFMGGIAVNVLGHCHKTFTDGLKDQLGKLVHTSSLYYVEHQAALAKKLCESSAFDRAFFANSGAEANEGAIKLARKYFYNQKKDRYEIITLKQSFHGRTLTTVTATGQEKYQKPYAPLTPGFVHVPINDIDALKRAVTPHTAAVMLELIQGESGVHACTKEYAAAVRKLCDEIGALLIVDEVQTGMGRTGTLFAYEQYPITPDIMTLAKGLGGGVPIGAVLATEAVAAAFTPGDHGTTFGGNPFCTRAGLLVMEILEKEHLITNARETGAYFMEQLNALGGHIKEVRGKGLMIGVELKVPAARKLQTRLFEHQFLVGAVGDSTLRLLPPLTLTREDVDMFVQTLSNLLKEGLV